MKRAMTTTALFLGHLFCAGALMGASTEEVTINAESLSAFKAITVSVVDPNETGDHPELKKQTRYTAYDGRAVFDKFLGGRAKWQKMKTINFLCSDGYRPSLPVKDFLRGKFYFAVARADAQEFAIVNNLKDGKKEDLSPTYLIWTDKGKQIKVNAHYWPYKLTKFSAD